MNDDTEPTRIPPSGWTEPGRLFEDVKILAKTTPFGESIRPGLEDYNEHTVSHDETVAWFFVFGTMLAYCRAARYALTGVGPQRYGVRATLNTELPLDLMEEGLVAVLKEHILGPEEINDKCPKTARIAAEALTTLGNLQRTGRPELSANLVLCLSPLYEATHYHECVRRAGKFWKILKGGLLGHEITHGTDEEKQGRWGELRSEWDRVRRENPGWTKERCDEEVFTLTGESARTVRRARTDYAK